MGNQISAVIRLQMSPDEIVQNVGRVAVLQKAYFFRGNEYCRYDVNADATAKGYPLKISGNWKGVWADGFDSAVAWPNNKIYFFKGKEYIRYDVALDKADEGYPRNISDNWPGVWSEGIDAVILWPTGKAYFFKGSEYIRYDIKKDKADEGYPRKIAENWPGLWTDKINSAVLWYNDKAYFFKGNEYIRYDVKSDKADPGYPRPIERNWKGLWETFVYDLRYVPDNDQRWTILPGNGHNHCVPASIHNLLSYMQWRGIPTSIKVPNNLKLKYTKDVYNIYALGQKMKTDPKRGTDYSLAFEGLEDWCSDLNINATIKGLACSDGIFINSEYIKSFLMEGVLLTISYGNWKKKKGSTKPLDRVGGHCVTLVGLRVLGTNCTLCVHDPWTGDDESETVQSLAETKEINPTIEKATLNGRNISVMLKNNWEGLSKDGKYQEETYQIYDSLLGIFPLTAWAFSNHHITWSRDDFSENSNLSQSSGSSPFPFDGDPRDLAIHPSDPWLAVVGDPNSGNVWQYDRHIDKWSVLTKLSSPVERLAFGGSSSPRLYVATADKISMINTRNGEILDSFKVRSSVSALAWNPKLHQLMFTDDTSKTLSRLDEKLVFQGKETFNPPSGTGRLDLSVNSIDGKIYTTRSESFEIVSAKVASNTKEIVTRRKLPFKAQSVQLTPTKNIAASIDGKFKMFNKDGEEIAKNPFPNLKTSSIIRLSESWSNLSSLEWYS